LKLFQKIIDALIVHAKEEAPNECCGLLGGQDGVIHQVYPIANLPSQDPMVFALQVPDDRRVRYVMDPKGQLLAQKQMRQTSMDLMGIYHSHPHSPAYPSATDVRLAFYPEVYYLIVSLGHGNNGENGKLPQVMAFRIVEQKVTPEPIEILPEPSGPQTPLGDSGNS